MVATPVAVAHARGVSASMAADSNDSGTLRKFPDFPGEHVLAHEGAEWMKSAYAVTGGCAPSSHRRDRRAAGSRGDHRHLFKLDATASGRTPLGSASHLRRLGRLSRKFLSTSLVYYLPSVAPGHLIWLHDTTPLSPPIPRFRVLPTSSRSPSISSRVRSHSVTLHPARAQ